MKSLYGSISILFMLTGCSSFDRAFRSRVGQVDVTASNSYADSRTGITDSSSAGVDFILRDPSKDGL